MKGKGRRVAVSGPGYRGTLPVEDLLTDLELEVIADCAQLANKVKTIIGPKIEGEADFREAITFIHGLQRMVMANAAARAYPSRLRRLGERV